MGDEPDDIVIKSEYQYFDAATGRVIMGRGLYQLGSGRTARPESPAWFAGRGYFTNRLPSGVPEGTTLYRRYWVSTPDNADRWEPGDAATITTTKEGFYETFQGVLCVIEARARAEKYVPEAILEETGVVLSEFIEGLIPGLLMAACAVGLTTLLGAGAGFAIGIFEAGVGAVPGTLIGAQLGFDAGMFLLTWMGVGFLVKAVAESLAEAVEHMKRGVYLAWQGRNSDVVRQYFVESGGREMAKGVAVLFRAVLEGVVLYVVGKDAVARTGKLVARSELVAELLSRLKWSGHTAFAQWLEVNLPALIDNPKLRGKVGGRRPDDAAPASGGAQGPPAKQEPKPRGEPAPESPGRQAPKPKEEPAPDPKKMTNAEKGVFGEAKGDEFMMGEGMQKMNGPPVKVGDKPLGQGIDGVWKNSSPPPEYVISETKYGSSRLGNTKDGPQMGDKWIDRRLDKAVGKVEADKIRDSMLEGNVEKWLLRVDESGKVTKSVMK